MPADDFYPPMLYSSLWTVVGLLLLTAIAGWGLLVWWRTRAPRAGRVRPVWNTPEGRLAQLKAEYIARIDEVIRRSIRGELPVRDAHQEISALVRRFVEEAIGVSAPRMTLTDLRASGVPALGPVTDVVGRLYPGEFGVDGAATLEESAQAARAVVASWS